MNYRHIYHAGNFADVLKHIVLIILVKALQRKETGFCYLDTHAGIGYYDLTSIQAQKSKEFANGFEKILTMPNPAECIQEYIRICSNTSLYPGSPAIVKALLRPQDRMALCELHPEDFQTLKKNFPHYKQISMHHLDAYLSVKALLPPKEKRGLILIDPPYEQSTEFSDIIDAIEDAIKRFSTGVYAIWYPVKHERAVKEFHQQLKEVTSRPFLNCELCIYPNDVGSQLNGCGMTIVNPPFKIDEEINSILPSLWETLSINQQGHYFCKMTE